MDRIKYECRVVIKSEAEYWIELKWWLTTLENDDGAVEWWSDAVDRESVAELGVRTEVFLNITIILINNWWTSC